MRVHQPPPSPSSPPQARPSLGLVSAAAEGSAAAHASASAPEGRGTEAQPLATRDAVLALLLRQGEATASELADALAVSVQAMRRHLRSLEEEALVEATASAAGPGRPTNHWRLTSRGQERFGDGSETFALGLLHTMAATLSPATVSSLMEQQAEEKARHYRSQIGSGSLQDRLQRLTELRRAEGYVADLGQDSSPEAPPGAWLIREHHCSVMRIAEEFPQVCDQELQLLRLTFPDCQIERVHWRLQEGHSCGFRLQPRRADFKAVHSSP